MAEITQELIDEAEVEEKRQATIAEMEPAVLAGLNIARVVAKQAPEKHRETYLQMLDEFEAKWQETKKNFLLLTCQFAGLLKMPPPDIAKWLPITEQKYGDAKANTFFSMKGPTVTM